MISNAEPITPWTRLIWISENDTGKQAMTQQTPVAESDERLEIHRLEPETSETGFADDVRAGLLAEPKRLFPKYFYDELGSQLFDAICLVPEYYLTRAEHEILTRYGDDIISSVSGKKTLLELGSGSGSKTRLIIEAILRKQRTLHYIPVDISASALENGSRILLQSYPELEVTGYASDYYKAIEALKDVKRDRTLALFLGSNIGNFDWDESERFLRAVRGVLKEGDALLLGADLKKDRRVLEAAYDDSLGITSAFNLNLLVRINRELNADFDVRAFKHLARFNESKGRIEVFVESLADQTVNIRGLEMAVHFRRGEQIHTENSHKYDLEQLSALASDAGFERTRSWFDSEERFSSNLLVAI
jgi:L-histidine Nalpha-methyltransferase